MTCSLWGWPPERIRDLGREINFDEELDLPINREFATIKIVRETREDSIGFLRRLFAIRTIERLAFDRDCQREKLLNQAQSPRSVSARSHPLPVAVSRRTVAARGHADIARHSQSGSHVITSLQARPDAKLYWKWRLRSRYPISHFIAAADHLAFVSSS